jgi:hypothetical protein
VILQGSRWSRVFVRGGDEEPTELFGSLSRLSSLSMSVYMFCDQSASIVHDSSGAMYVPHLESSLC